VQEPEGEEEGEGDLDMSKDEKLRLLEERYSKGEIDQELYEELKTEIESEIEGEPEPEEVISSVSVIPPKESETESEEPTISQGDDKFQQFITPQQKIKPESPDGENDEPQTIIKSNTIVCPNCKSESIQSYPDNSHSCASCGYRWI
jgi:hypothetical protein